jgi:hypothetical protein
VRTGTKVEVIAKVDPASISVLTTPMIACRDRHTYKYIYVIMPENVLLSSPEENAHVERYVGVVVTIPNASR